VGRGAPADYAARIQRLRAQRGLSQIELAALLGTTNVSVNRWEHQHARPSPTFWQAIVRLEAGYAASLLSGSSLLSTSPPPATGAPQSPMAMALPIPVTSFVGRQRELAEVRRLLKQTRLLTLTGTGGCGKTRIALEILHTARPGEWQAISYVELAPVAQPAHLLQAVASAIGVHEEPGRALVETVALALRVPRSLLVFDNCEHLLDGCATLCASLLAACPELRVLATSRERLGIEGEQVYELPPLALPIAEAAQPDDVAESEAGSLFLARARARRPSFLLTAATATAVAEICRRVDGLPLALELAAARVHSLSVREIADRLNDRFRLLTGGSRTVAARHQTLRAAIDWSYDLLTPAEQAVFERLSVFAGSFSLDAAEAVCACSVHPAEDALDVLGRLLDKSLVMSLTAGSGARSRYALLETLRAYSWEKLTARGDETSTRRAHADHYLYLAELAAAEGEGSEQAIWLERLDADRGNLRVALQWYGERGEAEPYLRLAGALGWSWQLRGQYSEGLGWLAAAPRAEEGIATATQAKALEVAGQLAGLQGKYLAAQQQLEASLALWRQAGDRRGITHTLNGLANVLYERGEYLPARVLLEESLALARAANDRPAIAANLRDLGYIAQIEASYAAAQALYEEGEALCQEIGDAATLSDFRNALAILAYDRGDFTTARALYAANLAACEAIDYKYGVGLAYINLSLLNHKEGNFGEALDGLRTVLQIAVEAGNERGTGNLLQFLAIVLPDLGQFRRAAQLMGAAEALLATIGCGLSPWYRVEYAAAQTAVRAALGCAEFTATTAQGAALSVQQAVILALDRCAEPDLTPVSDTRGAVTPARSSVSPANLTDRELQVLRLIASGASNREIAATLVVSVRTIERHVSNVYAKLGVHNRIAASTALGARPLPKA